MRSLFMILAFLLIVTPSMGAVPDSYHHVASLGLDRYGGGDPGQYRVTLGYRYYFESVDDDDRPYRLQPFLQQASYAEVALLDGLGETILTGRGRYAFPGTDIAASAILGLGEMVGGFKNSLLGAGVAYYLLPDNNLAAEAVFTSKKYEWNPPGPVTQIETRNERFVVGVRYAMPIPRGDAIVELAGGFRWNSSKDVADGNVRYDDSGLVVEGRYYFNKTWFAGVSFSSDTDLLSATGGYSSDEGFTAEVEFGREDNPLPNTQGGESLRIGLGLRF